MAFFQAFPQKFRVDSLQEQVREAYEELKKKSENVEKEWNFIVTLHSEPCGTAQAPTLPDGRC